MFYACVQRFDGMDKKFLGGELNRAKVFGSTFWLETSARFLNQNVHCSCIIRCCVIKTMFLAIKLITCSLFSVTMNLK